MSLNTEKTDQKEFDAALQTLEESIGEYRSIKDRAQYDWDVIQRFEKRIITAFVDCLIAQNKPGPSKKFIEWEGYLKAFGLIDVEIRIIQSNALRDMARMILQLESEKAAAGTSQAITAEKRTEIRKTVEKPE